MRSRLAITTAVSLTALSLCAAGAVALYGASPASALAATSLAAGAPQASGTPQASGSTAGNPGTPQASREPQQPQVPGTVLLTALLPVSDFGAGFTQVASGAPDSGSQLQPAGPGLNPALLDCSDFESVVYLDAYGQTGGALLSFTNPGWQADNPDIWDGQELVYQFATAQAAVTFYQRAYAKYQACQPLTVPQPSDTAVGGGALDLSTMWITKTTVAGYPAFEQVQSAARSETSGWNFWRNTLTVIAGPDVYQFLDYSGTDDEPSPALMTELIRNVQQLR
jgi:hypothetical protein